MKYLKGRDNYLNELKVNSGLVPYTKNDSIIKLNEEALTNSTKWGDSLLGRLINSAIRKAKIGVGLLRINNVIKSLYKLFDDMVADGVIKEMPVASRIKIYKFYLIKFIEEVEKVSADPSDYVLNEPGAEDDAEVEGIDEIKNMTDAVITDIEKYMSDIISDSESSGEIPKNEIDELELDKKDLIEALTKFRESLDEIKAPEGDKEETPVVEEPKKTEFVYSENMVSNLKSVYMILFYYHQTIVSKKPVAGVAKPEEIKKPQPENMGKTSAVVNKIKVTESVLNESVLNPNLSNAIKPLYTYFKSEGKFVFPGESKDRENEFHKFLPQNKDGILKVYKSISLIKEDLTTLLTKPEKVGSHIFNLYKTTRTKPNGDFQGVEGDFQSQIKIFNTTMKSILDTVKVEPKAEAGEDDIEVGKRYKYTNKKGEVKDVLVVDKDKVVQPGPDKKFLTGDDEKGKDINDGEVSVASDKSKVSFPVRPDSLKKESKISNYFDFIKEADENKDTWLVKVHESWKTNFLGNFKNLKKYKLTQEEIDKLVQEVETASKNTKSLKIVGKDPVIEIVRLFNRAYRLHTTQVIPTGRSGGVVSNKTFMEYTSFGSGTPENAGFGGGPYRNNALFTKWENAVLDIISSSKYRIIFNEEATIQVGEGNPVEDFGRKLLTFMNNLLDNVKMYEDGEQKKFIDKYFNIDTKTGELNSPGMNDEKTNAKNASSQKQKNVDFTEQDEIKFEEGQIFKFNYKEGTLYGHVYSIKNNKTYIKFSKNHLFVKKYLPGDIKFKTTPRSVDGPVYFGEIKGAKLTKNKYKLDSCLDVSKKVEKNEVDKSFNIEFLPSKIYLLKEDGSTESYIVDTQSKDFDSTRFLSKRDSKKPQGYDGWYKLFIS